MSRPASVSASVFGLAIWKEPGAPASEVAVPAAAAAQRDLVEFERLVRGFRSFHLLGTDRVGRDYLSRLIYGSQISLLIAFATVVISGLIGTTLGVIAGYFGGRVDMVVNFLINTRLERMQRPTGLADDDHKLELARRFGADHTIVVDQEDTVQRVQEITDGRGADVTLELTPIAQDPVSHALECTKHGGRVVLAGLKGGKAVPLNTDMMINRALTIVGAYGVNAAANKEAIRIIHSEQFPLHEMHTHTLGLDDAADLVEPAYASDGEAGVAALDGDAPQVLGADPGGEGEQQATLERGVVEERVAEAGPAVLEGDLAGDLVEDDDVGRQACLDGVLGEDALGEPVQGGDRRGVDLLERRAEL
jgi:hypothetical protein